ncbi:MAG: HAD hydrolase-like protein [Candidatus Bathyarchaeia archaeon]
MFQETLKKLHTQATEAIYIGDSPLEDIKGSKEAGIKVVFVSSQFNSLADLLNSHQKPDFTSEDLKWISDNFDKIMSAHVSC